MKVLVIGSGGREHALCWRLSKSASVEQILCAPGSDAISKLAKCLPIAVGQIDELLQLASSERIDLTVVGPELPLTLGIVDRFRAAGIAIFGPTQAAASLEGSKAFCKEIVEAAGVATAKATVYPDVAAASRRVKAPVVLKVDGLAAGKGVFVCSDSAALDQALESLRAEFANEKVLAEELLRGVEVSVIVATDGQRYVPLSSAHDYKRIFDGDGGPNTGGMGTVSPSPRITAAQLDSVYSDVVEPVLNEMRKRSIPFCGFLYAGIMLGDDGVARVLEFNARMGDPECQVIMPRFESDLAELLLALAQTRNIVPPVSWSNKAAVCVVLAAAGYPGKVSSGDRIEGINLAQAIPGVTIFHAGTKLGADGCFQSAGGRVLNICALGDDHESARALAYRAADMIQFKGRQMRRDIGLR